MALHYAAKYGLEKIQAGYLLRPKCRGGHLSQVHDSRRGVPSNLTETAVQRR